MSVIPFPCLFYKLYTNFKSFSIPKALFFGIWLKKVKFLYGKERKTLKNIIEKTQDCNLGEKWL